MLHIWFSDERFVPHDNPDRSDTTSISGFGMCKSQIVFHRVADSGDLEEAAQGYAEEVDDELDARPFDAVILSMGEDGHIASLFPGLLDPEFAGSTVAVHNSPKAPPRYGSSIRREQMVKLSAEHRERSHRSNIRACEKELLQEVRLGECCEVAEPERA